MTEKILDTVTDTDQVRSVLGISVRDMDDDKLDTPRVELELTIAMTESAIDYATIIAEGTATSPAPSEEEKLRYQYLKLFSIYYCAVVIIPRLRLAATQKIGDGDNSMERFLNPEFDKLEKAYKSKVEAFKSALQDAISGTPTAATIYSPLSGVSPSYDPVTG